MTTVKDGLFQFGGSPVGGGVLGMSALGGAGTSWFVDPASGGGGSGKKPSSALASVGAAYALTTDKAGDVIYYLNDGNTTGSSRESTIPLVWSNDNTHLVGCCAPVPMSQRARITPVSTAALTAEPVLSVTGNGNSFYNVQIAHFGADTNGIAARGVDVTGNRNYFYNCHIVGIPNDHTGDEAGACDLKVTGEENMFERCYFGVNTVVRSDANANVLFDSSATRIHFKECFFTLKADEVTPYFVNAPAAADIDREILFDNCTFYNPIGSGSTELTGAFSVHASAGGDMILKDCMIIGAADIEAADAANIFHLGSTWDASTLLNMSLAGTVDIA